MVREHQITITATSSKNTDPDRNSIRTAMTLKRVANRVQPAVEVVGVVGAGAVHISRMRVNGNSRQTVATNRLQMYRQHLSIRPKKPSQSWLNKEAKSCSLKQI